VSGSDDTTIKVWDLQNGDEVACCKGQEGWIVGVQFSPDEKSVVCIDKNSLRVIHTCHMFTFCHRYMSLCSGGLLMEGTFKPTT
jgi:WD40 repeat protein